jgi:hypothetical protein
MLVVDGNTTLEVIFPTLFAIYTYCPKSSVDTTEYEYLPSEHERSSRTVCNEPVETLGVV